MIFSLELDFLMGALSWIKFLLQSGNGSGEEWCINQVRLGDGK